MKYLFFLFSIFTFLFFSCSKNEEALDDYSKDSGTFVDERDGHEYKWAKIGDQWWMAENLAFLPNVNPRTDESDSAPFYYVYENNGSNIDEAKVSDYYKTYGVLYNWSASKMSCPEGWHLPSDDEWEKLAQYISDQKGPYSKSDDDWSGVGKHLKSKTGWENNGDGTNDFGFTALPGGEKAQNGFFRMSGLTSYYWSNTPYSENDFAWMRLLSDDTDKFHRSFQLKTCGFSVRCVKD